MMHTPLLDQRTIIVTGAATGIGQAFAVQCASQGANVVVADMNAAAETVAAVEAAGGKALAVLAERNLGRTTAGESILSVALLLDIAAIPVLALVPVLVMAPT